MLPGMQRPAASSDLDAQVEGLYARLVVDDARARPDLHRLGPLVAGQPLPEALWAAAGVIACCVEFGDFRGHANWISRLVALYPHVLAAATPLQRLRLQAAWLCLHTLDHAQPDGDAVTRAAEQEVLKALRGGAPTGPDECMLLYKLLLEHHSMRNEAQSVDRIATLAQDLLQTADCSPVWHARWWMLMAHMHDYFGRAAQANDCLDRVRALARPPGWENCRYALANHDLEAALKEDDIPRADRAFREIEQLAPWARAGHVLRGLSAQARLLVRKGELQAALDRIELILSLCEDIEVPLRDRSGYLVLRAHALIALGRHEDARDQLVAVRAHQQGGQRAVLDAVTACAEAAAALERTPAEAGAQVRAAIERCAAAGYPRFLMPLPAHAARLAAAALDEGVEREFVVAAIRDRRLTPPDPTRADWPWRVQVEVLGELRIRRDGEPLHSSGKAQKKPLELLALLAAHGGEPLASQAVIDDLWPSDEAAAPRASFEMALTRLRKWLELPDAVVSGQGTVRLHPGLVWSDAGAFNELHRRLVQALRALRRAPGDPPSPEIGAIAERLFALYRDRLLGSDDTLSRLARTARERLALKFSGAVVDYGAHLEACGAWAEAAVLYERALAQDMFAEPVYRALIAVYLQLGERPQAVRTWRRCRDVLANLLGTPPSAQTLAVARRLEAD